MTTMTIIDTTNHYEVVQSQVIEMLTEDYMKERNLSDEEANELAVETVTEAMDSESYDYLWDLAWEEELESAENIITRLIKDYEKRYKTTVSYIAWKGERSSHYGAIGGNGASCVAVKDWEAHQPFINTLPTGEYGTKLEVETGKDGGVILEVSDHDGTNHTSLVLITESMIERNTTEDNYYWEDIAEQLAQKREPVKVSKSLLERITK